MTQQFFDVINLFGAGSIGYEYNPDHKLDTEEILKISVNQGIWQIVYLALDKISDVASYKKAFMSSVYRSISRNEFVYKEIQTLKAHGIDCCYLKGITVARFYKDPHCRISGDTDILIPKYSLKKARKILLKDGFEVESIRGNMHHYKAYHKSAGLIELHKELYQKHINDLLFNNTLKFDKPHMNIIADGKQVEVLDINDGLNHLTSHFIKHFVSKGVGLRQLMDLLLYMDNYKEDIDWETFNKTWSELGFLNLINNLMGIGNKYWKMNFKQVENDCIDNILDDIESSGAFGFSQSERSGFINIILAERNKDDIEQFRNYMGKNYGQPVFWRFFPSKEYMVKMGYAEPDKGLFRFSIAYIKRFISLVIMHIKGDRNISESFVYQVKQPTNDVEKKRLNLMKDLGILDK